jgi:hypothetical protein
MIADDLHPIGTFVLNQDSGYDLGIRHPTSAYVGAWLPFLDKYRTMCLVPKPEFRQILLDIELEEPLEG